MELVAITLNNELLSMLFVRSKFWVSDKADEGRSLFYCFRRVRRADVLIPQEKVNPMLAYLGLWLNANGN